MILFDWIAQTIIYATVAACVPWAIGGVSFMVWSFIGVALGWWT